VVQNSNIRSRNEQSARVRKRAEARRLEILRGAARVFRKRGFAAAGMREIAREIDLSPGNLYHYFKSKDEILFFCQDRSLDVMLAALQSARLSGRSPAEQLGSALRAHVHCLLDELEGAVAHLEVEALPDELRAPIVRRQVDHAGDARRGQLERALVPSRGTALGGVGGRRTGRLPDRRAGGRPQTCSRTGGARWVNRAF
jgi:AcrR family transcriptional regulator